MSDESKTKLLERLKAGREKIKAARAAAKAEGKPDPKPRKARAKKGEAALENPAAAPAAREDITPISGAPRNAVNTVAATPVNPEVTKTTPIDVPNLPGENPKVKSKADIVKNAEKIPEARPSNGISSTGRPKEYDANDNMVNGETGDMAVQAQYPGQKESIKKELKDIKTKNDALANKPNPMPKNTTVKDVKKHVPDVKTLEARAPFSFSAVRKLLYQ